MTYPTFKDGMNEMLLDAKRCLACLEVHQIENASDREHFLKDVGDARRSLESAEQAFINDVPALNHAVMFDLMQLDQSLSWALFVARPHWQDDDSMIRFYKRFQSTMHQEVLRALESTRQ